jgi:hypothetical protein
MAGAAAGVPAVIRVVEIIKSAVDEEYALVARETVSVTEWVTPLAPTTTSTRKPARLTINTILIPSSRTKPGLGRRRARAIVVVEPVVGGNFVAPGIDIDGSGEGIATMDVIVLAVARLVEVDTRSFFNPAPPVCLTTESVRAQRLGSRGRAEALFDQVMCRFLRPSRVTVSDNLIQVNHRRSVAWPHPLKWGQHDPASDACA